MVKLDRFVQLVHQRSIPVIQNIDYFDPNKTILIVSDNSRSLDTLWYSIMSDVDEFRIISNVVKPKKEIYLTTGVRLRFVLPDTDYLQGISNHNTAIYFWE